MKIGFQAIELVLYGLIPSVLAGFVYIYWKKPSLKIPNKMELLFFLLSGILSFIGYMLLRYAQIHSPNIGYVNSIVYSSVLVTILLTAVLFKDSLHWQGVVGSIFIVLGLGLVTSIKDSSVQSHITRA
jgi:drug/metabolite transporter (DMT)-like permease